MWGAPRVFGDWHAPLYTLGSGPKQSPRAAKLKAGLARPAVVVWVMQGKTALQGTRR